MNNSNNPTRIIIDLDGSLDELDDDDITLPDLPSAEDIPIIETPRVEQQREVTPASTLSPESKPVESKPVAPAVQQTTADTQPLTQTSAQKAQQAEEDKKRGGWFSRMKSGLTKSRKNLAEGVANILIGGKEIDDELLEEVEDQLLVADIGVEATDKIIKSLTEQTARGDLIYSHSLYKALQKELVEILEPKVAPLIIDTSKKPFVILVVGVNGVGKTTTIGKLAKRLQAEGKSVMLAAGDTFRAAATEQLQIWGERNNIPVVAQGHGADSASVVFDAMQSAKAKNIDVLIADTAGRLQNKTHLMAELEKVVRIMRKSDPTAPHEGMIVLDAGTGQNAINQVKIFNDAVPLTGITITKLDGTAKGGVVFNIANTTDIPIRYIGVGESIDDLRAFSPKQFVAALFETDE
ncbi:signal recognition particle-docking protein FtsY [Psychrobacter sanguinis]|uniref:signal recognition particle-docking protein FtsY n=1 Tax=Psychrobacter sanguinis TaxID=861445 RepID=UPI00191961F0|nr:signal recognition particle-docking protein FtsY [Psychrobacter sanguinis]MCC3344671.1 signal recognition particle-docking protein FtsY [Psychrobacter sanguinis]